MSYKSSKYVITSSHLWFFFSHYKAFFFTLLSNHLSLMTTNIISLMRHYTNPWIGHRYCAHLALATFQVCISRFAASDNMTHSHTVVMTETAFVLRWCHNLYTWQPNVTAIVRVFFLIFSVTTHNTWTGMAGLGKLPVAAPSRDQVVQKKW